MAQRVLQQKEHEIHIDECRLRVQVQALELPVVTAVQVTEQQGPGTCRAAMHWGPEEQGWTSPSCLPLGVHSGKQAERAGQWVSRRAPAE